MGGEGEREKGRERKGKMAGEKGGGGVARGEKRD